MELVFPLSDSFVQIVKDEGITTGMIFWNDKI